MSANAMRYRDVLAMASFALRGNWLRSGLTALGVIIGIAAVIVMVAVGQGTQAELDRTIASLGANRIDISPNLSRLNSAVSGVGGLFTLTTRDVTALSERLPEIEHVSGILQGRTQVINAELNWATQWQGVEPAFLKIGDWRLSHGQWIDPAEYAAASTQVLLGQSVREKLYGESDPSGEKLRIGNTDFIIAGVLQAKGQGSAGNDQDDVILVPIETARRRLMGRIGMPPASVMTIALSVARAEDLAYVEREVHAILLETHLLGAGAQPDFVVRNLTQIVSARSQTTRLMSLLLAAVASISLLVGGIGIMNIMLVAVTERTREIGLRMSIGASPRRIRQQFLTEALLLSLGGGAIGVVCGIAGAELLAHLASLPVKLNGNIIAVAAAFSVATGLFFGYYPARKAAQLDPIEALRHQG